MLVRDYLGQYLSERDVSAEYKRDLRYSVCYLDRWAERSIDLSELADDLINRWLQHLGTQMRARSVKHHRANLLALWRSAAEVGIVDTWPRRVRKIKVPRTLPEAWAIEQMRLLLTAAEKLTGVFRFFAIARAAFWRAYILLGWNTGLRPSDMVRLRFDQIGTNGVLIHVAHKTNEVIICPLWPETVAAIESISQPGREVIFGSVIGLDACRRQFTKLAKAAGLKGSPKKLRKSSATAVEAAHGEGAASKFLAHRTTEMARLHYVDPTHIRPNRPMPPPLAG